MEFKIKSCKWKVMLSLQQWLKCVLVFPFPRFCEVIIWLQQKLYIQLNPQFKDSGFAILKCWGDIKNRYAIKRLCDSQIKLNKFALNIKEMPATEWM